MSESVCHVTVCERKFTVEIERGEDGWLVAQCREMRGAITQGRNMNEIRRNIKEAIQLVLEELESR
ncbi:MAG: type II toxin-antitoxin system HicB family antitoxin [Candidatus Bathyarchaeia archaeon]